MSQADTSANEAGTRSPKYRPNMPPMASAENGTPAARARSCRPWASRAVWADRRS
ncbi:Uncharacterised protein [Bordetella pertussis]|nr:Uncharacterised protein [Bordetella pertussis]